MTIQRVVPATEIQVGQWICRESLFVHTPCGAPRRVLKVSGQRVYFSNRRDEDDGDYCLRKSVVFVCDTHAEGQSLAAIADAEREATFAAVRVVRKVYEAKIEALIAVGLEP